MKQKAVAACSWAFALSLVLVFPISLSDVAKAQLLDSNLSLSILAQQLQTPDQIARYMWRNFAFEEDQRNFGTEDHMQSPEEFLQTRKGDCEDFARFAYELLKMNGVDAFIMNIYGGQYAHSICVFKENGNYQAIDGTNVRRYNAKHLNDLSSQIYAFWKTSMIVSPSPVSGGATVLAEFSKRMDSRRRLGIFS